MMKPVQGIAGIIDKYDLLLLDLWGVVHDGTALYPGVKDAVEQLKAQNKKVIFLSNAPRRSHKVKAVLSELGIDESLYLDAVSSGEVGYQWLAEGNAPWGKSYYYIGPSKDADVLDGLDYKRVDDIKQADFLLNVGFGSEEQTKDDFSMLLSGAQKASLPMLCLNPDLEVVKITGERFACAGVLGKQYEQLGGEVVWFGKPYAAVYEFCAAEAHVGKERILAVGDSLETDIPGGQAYGVDTMLITGGILKHTKPEQVVAECEKRGVNPHYVSLHFSY